MDLKLIQELFNTRTKNQQKKEHDEKFKLSVKTNLNEIEQIIESFMRHFLDLEFFCRSIRETGCENIKRHTLNIVLYYQNELIKILKNEFDLILKSVSYPYNREIIQQNILNQTKAHMSINLGGVYIQNYPSINDSSEVNIRSCVQRLLKIESISSKSLINNQAKIRNNDNINSIVISLLVKPLEKRFKYHFFGSRKTNNLDKVKEFEIVAFILFFLQNLNRIALYSHLSL